MKLILASKSPRRREMLQRFNVECGFDQADVVELFSPEQLVEKQIVELARNKAEVVAARHPGSFVLAADTTVVLSEPGQPRKIFEKPRDAADAARMLGELSGKTHQVLTAYCIVEAESKTRRERLVRTSVRFRHLSPEMIGAYVATGEPLDKAGAYGIQGRAEGFVESVSGSYSNVVGLPLAEVLDDLQQLGLWDWSRL